MGTGIDKAGPDVTGRIYQSHAVKRVYIPKAKHCHVVEVDIQGYYDSIPHGPLLANIYLNPLDQLLMRQRYRVIRYDDDMVVLCLEAKTAQRALEVIEDWMKQAGLTLHPEKTRIVDMQQENAYFDFLGYRFKQNRHSGKIDCWPRPKSVAKLKERLRPLTRRFNGHSLSQIMRYFVCGCRGRWLWFGRWR
jgi:RNA-directed DNA polymerase